MSRSESGTANLLQLQMLEISYLSFISGGASRSTLTNQLVGVYAGLFTILPGGSFFGASLKQSNAKPSLSQVTANSVSVASGRISYVLGLTGPCFPVDSACSASLVATHLALSGLQLVECEQACIRGASWKKTCMQLSARLACFQIVGVATPLTVVLTVIAAAKAVFLLFSNPVAKGQPALQLQFDKMDQVQV